MFYRSDNKELYIEEMDALKKMNAEYIAIKNSKEYKQGREFFLLQDTLKKRNFKKLIALVKKKRRLKKAGNIANDCVHKNDMASYKPIYFSTERFVVYTCIIGDYDKILDPITRPDNCDFYLVTDKKRNVDTSIWKEIIVDKDKYNLSKMSNTEINRYFKMHPDVLFPMYKYSIYIDGNIKVITDLTEYINRIPVCGLALHAHGKRNCVFKEANTIIALGKEKKASIIHHLAILKKMGFPERYGLIECNIIAREHHNKICKSLMQMWWSDFLNFSKRDQMSLPSVLFRHGIQVSEVTTLGTGVENDYAVRIEAHI